MKRYELLDAFMGLNLYSLLSKSLTSFLQTNFTSVAALVGMYDGTLYFKLASLSWRSVKTPVFLL